MKRTTSSIHIFDSLLFASLSAANMTVSLYLAALGKVCLPAFFSTGNFLVGYKVLA